MISLFWWHALHDILEIPSLPQLIYMWILKENKMRWDDNGNNTSSSITYTAAYLDILCYCSSMKWGMQAGLFHNQGMRLLWATWYDEFSMTIFDINDT